MKQSTNNYKPLDQYNHYIKHPFKQSFEHSFGRLNHSLDPSRTINTSKQYPSLRDMQVTTPWRRVAGLGPYGVPWGPKIKKLCQWRAHMISKNATKCHSAFWSNFGTDQKSIPVTPQNGALQGLMGTLFSTLVGPSADWHGRSIIKRADQS